MCLDGCYMPVREGKKKTAYQRRFKNIFEKALQMFHVFKKKSFQFVRPEGPTQYFSVRTCSQCT